MQELLYVSIASVFLAISNPVFAYTEAAQIKAMQNKLNGMQNQLSQVTSGLTNQSSAGKGWEGC